MKACADAATNEQEQQFLAALQASTAFDRTGNVLTLRAEGGDNQATLAPAE